MRCLFLFVLSLLTALKPQSEFNNVAASVSSGVYSLANGSNSRAQGDIVLLNKPSKTKSSTIINDIKWTKAANSHTEEAQSSKSPKCHVNQMWSNYKLRLLMKQTFESQTAIMTNNETNAIFPNDVKRLHRKKNKKTKINVEKWAQSLESKPIRKNNPWVPGNRRLRHSDYAKENRRNAKR